MIWVTYLSQTSGVIVWQLNDCWPVTSWAIVDYFVRSFNLMLFALLMCSSYDPNLHIIPSLASYAA
jgi:hypothetical protein